MDNNENILDELFDGEHRNIVVLNDENGNEVEFEFLDLIELDGEEYIILLPTDDEDDGEVVILKIEEGRSDEEESYSSVDDPDTLMAVFEIFKEKFKDDFNFVD